MSEGKFSFSSLRDWIKFLEDKGELIRTKFPVDLRGDVAAASRKIGRTNGPALLHENIHGYPGWRIFTDGLTTRQRQVWALNLPLDKTCQSVSDKLKREVIKPKILQTGPCKEVKLFEDEIDLVKFPIPFAGEFQTTPHITAGISLIKDPETGWANAGIRRFQFIGRRRLCNLILPYQHEGIIFSKYMKLNRPMPISIAIGTDPIFCLCSMIPAPEQFDEMDYWGPFAGEPLEVVRSETNDILVPASAEIIIEGEIRNLSERRFEGPFSEFPGYYSGFRKTPVIDIKAITMREDAIYQDMYMALPPSEGHNTMGFMLEVELYRQVKSLVPQMVDVGVLSTGGLTCAISISKESLKKSPGLNKKLAMAVKAVRSGAFVKNLFIVDDDVDVHNLHDILWSMSVKFQPAKDIDVISDTPGVFLDPSELWVGHGGRYSGHSSFGVFHCTEKLPPFDEGYSRGLTLPPKESLDKIEKELSQR